MQSKLRKSLTYVIHGGVATSAMDTLAVGPTLMAYAKLLGAGNIAFGILGGIPYLGNLIHLLAASLLTKGFSVKKISIWSSLISRPFYLFAALLAFCPNMPGALELLVFFLTCSYLIGCLSGGCWLPWMKVLIPERIMGRFFARRFRYMQIAKVLCSFGAAYLLKTVKDANPTYEIYVYAFFFILAFIIGLYGVYTFYNVEDKPVDIRSDIPFLKQVVQTFSNKPFRLLLICLSLINFGFLFITPFITVFMLNRLDFSGASILIFSLISQMSYIFIIKKLGFIGDRFGSDQILRVALNFTLLILIGLIGINYLSCSTGMLMFLIGILHVLLGFATAGYTLGLNNASLLYVPKETATVYLSVNSVFKSLAGAIGSFVAGFVLSACAFISHKLSGDITAQNTPAEWTLFFCIAILIVCLGLVLLRLLDKYRRPTTRTA